MSVAALQHEQRPPGTRICFLISSFTPGVGGAERATQRLAATLASRGDDVLVLTRHRYRGAPRAETIDGVRVERKGLLAQGKLGALTYAIHCLASLATRHRAFRIVHAQNPDTPLLIGFIAGLLLRRRLFVTAHSDPRVILEGRRTDSARIGLMNRLAEGVGALSPKMMELLVEVGLDPSLLCVLPNGIDTRTYRRPTGEERRQARARAEIPDDAAAYVFVGRLEHVKRVDVLLQAWSLSEEGARPRKLFILGDGDERAGLETLAERLGLANVQFLGARDDVLQYLWAGDVFVLPSDREGQSVALLEAMAAGLVPVVSDVAGNVSVVENDRSGLVFPAGSAEELADRLGIIESGTLRDRLRDEASEVGAANSLERSATLHQRLYGDVR